MGESRQTDGPEQDREAREPWEAGVTKRQTDQEKQQSREVRAQISWGEKGVRKATASEKDHRKTSKKKWEGTKGSQVKDQATQITGAREVYILVD